MAPARTRRPAVGLADEANNEVRTTLDRGARSGDTPAELEGKKPPRGSRFLSWARLVGAVIAILYGVVGVSLGLSQQQRGLAPGEIDCVYRVELLRDRVVALTERSPNQRGGDPQVDVVSNSIRETLAACSEDEHARRRLEAIGTHLSQHAQRTAGDEEARRELLAL